MASFTDTPHGFSPYIKTLPTESYYTVGTIKQKEFDEGLQRVQGAIDNIASLPVARDVDKQYVKSALDSLKEGLQTSAVADFSNTQLINQVGAAASKIQGDPIIQKSIASAMRVKKGITELDEAKKAGKSSPQNEYYLTSQINSWMNSSDLNQEFTGSYSPYIDVVDEVMKVYKEMPDSENLERDAFRMENGKLTYNPTLLKGKSTKRVQDVIDLVTGKPDVANQLVIDGEYKYKGLSPEQLFKSMTESTSNQISNINESIRSLQTRIATDGTVNPQEVNSELTNLKQYAAQLKDGYNQHIELLNNNPSALKTSLAKQELSSNFLGAFSSEIAVDNPLWKAYLDEQNASLAQQKFIWEQGKDIRDYNLNVKKYELDVQKEVNSASKKKKEEGGGISTSPSLVDESTGKVSSETFTNSLNNTKAAYGREMQQQANLIAGAAQIPLPWKENANGTFAPNIGTNIKTQYPTGTSAWKTTEELIKRAAQGYEGAQPSTTAKIAVDKLRKMKDNINTREKTRIGIEDQFNTSLSKAGVKSEDVPYYLVAMVDKGVEGSAEIEQRLVNTYGYDYKKALGIEEQTPGGDEFGRTTPTPLVNSSKYLQARKAINNNLSGVISDRELAYKNAQGQLQSVDVQLNYTKDSEELPIIQKFDDVVKLATADKTASKGDAARLSALLKRDNKTGNINTYHTQFNDRTGTGSITVRRGTKESETISGIPRSDYFTIFGDLQVDNTFNQKFQDRLELSNWKTTNVFNDGKNDSYLLDVDKKGDNTVQYHLIEGTVPGTYRIQLWVGYNNNYISKLPADQQDAAQKKILIGGEPFDNGAEESTQMDRATVVQMLDWLKSPTNLKLYLTTKGIK